MSFVVTHPETSASAARNPQAIGSTAANATSAR
ncbi:MAG: PE domain-containing protein [Mycobacterium sp.]|nr:MAG: PE domain-containing protein [Mycobacterium sp.]